PPLPGTSRIPLSTGETVRGDVHAAVPLPRVYMAARVPPFTTEAFYAGEIASNVIGRGRSSRLYDRLVRRRVAKSASCHLLPLTSGATMFLVIATGFPETRADELEAAVSTELDTAADLDESEVARAVIGSETRTLRALQRLETRADSLSMYATLFGDARRLNEDLRRLRRVTPDEARQWCGTYLHAGNRAVVRYLPGEGKGVRPGASDREVAGA
ncbi:MAG: insulinase family protein, partial [Gemmatimonadetes bacterium]|nr:insulinase family protein [Gemmatimonadota bacterium]